MNNDDAWFIFFLGCILTLTVNISLSNFDTEIDFDRSFVIEKVYPNHDMSGCYHQFQVKTLIGEDFTYMTDCGSYKVGDTLFSLNPPTN